MSDNDRRYRVLVMLQRVDRPKHWVFHCPNCMREIKELDTDMTTMTDVFDASDKGNGIRCETGWCRTYWYFQVSE